MCSEFVPVSSEKSIKEVSQGLRKDRPHICLSLQKATVQRVDDKLGVLLSLPGHGTGYAHISDIADEKVDNLAKVLKVGQDESARVIGSRPMDGLAVLSLKPSAIEQFLMVRMVCA